MRTTALLAALIALLATASSTLGAAGHTSSVLQFSSSFRLQLANVACPPGTPTTTVCFPVKSQTAIPGLGQVTVSYLVLKDHPETNCSRSSWTPVVFTVAGKGQINAALTAQDASAQCDPPDGTIPRANFTITGGTGKYSGASGSGTEYAGDFVSDVWTGTISVPGYQFDTTPPAIHGAISKTVRVSHHATRTRVTYNVTAKDATDGPVPVKCTPTSGSRFKLGRTRVVCTATDSSANMASTSFTVTIKKH